MRVPDDMTNERWNEAAGEIAPGWTPGRVECGGACGPAFGWVKGSFGVFEGCSETNVGLLELSSLTHLKSGMRVAFFAMPDVAATAAELAERVGDWSEISTDGLPTVKWKQRAKEMYALWQSAGMQYGPVIILTPGISFGKAVWCALEPIEKRQ